MENSAIFCAATFSIAPVIGGLMPCNGTQSAKESVALSALRHGTLSGGRAAVLNGRKVGALPQMIRTYAFKAGSGTL